MTHLFADPEFWVLLAVVVFAAIVWKPMRSYVVGTLDDMTPEHRNRVLELR